MAERDRQKRGLHGVGKKRTSDGSEKKSRKIKKTEKQNAATTALSLLADESAIDPTLSSLFATKVSPTNLP